MGNYLLIALLTGIVGGLNAQSDIDFDLLPPVEDLMEQVTFPDADTIILCTNGGPTSDLETDYFTFYHSIPTFSTVYVRQYQQYNLAVMDDFELTLENAIICNDTGVAILKKVVNHFNDLGKTVVITGHSFGSFVIAEYLDDYGNEDVHRLIPMAGRINMTTEVWEAFATGFWAGFDTDGTTVWVNDEVEDDSELAGMKLMAGYGYNRHIDSLAALDLTNLMYLYGTNDEAVGSLTEDEVNFLNITNASVVAVDGGDHGSMFAEVYMNQALDFIRGIAADVGLRDYAFNEASLKAYPTVSNGSINVELKESGQLIIHNMMGELIVNQSFAEGIHLLDLAGNEPGLYVISYVSNSGEKVQNKIIIQ